MEKVYLVIHNYSCENNGNIDIQNIKVFKDYFGAKKCFETIKKGIKSFELNYSSVEEKDDYYCEYECGEYFYYHELVYIKEKEVL